MTVAKLANLIAYLTWAAEECADVATECSRLRRDVSGDDPASAVLRGIRERAGIHETICREDLARLEEMMRTITPEMVPVGHLDMMTAQRDEVIAERDAALAMLRRLADALDTLTGHDYDISDDSEYALIAARELLLQE